MNASDWSGLDDMVDDAFRGPSTGSALVGWLKLAKT